MGRVLAKGEMWLTRPAARLRPRNFGGSGPVDTQPSDLQFAVSGKNPAKQPLANGCYPLATGKRSCSRKLSDAQGGDRKSDNKLNSLIGRSKKPSAKRIFPNASQGAGNNSPPYRANCWRKPWRLGRFFRRCCLRADFVPAARTKPLSCPGDPVYPEKQVVTHAVVFP